MLISWFAFKNVESLAALYGSNFVKINPKKAIIGPNKGTCVYDHIKDVTTCLYSKKLDCVGCHFSHPFRAACETGCMSLYSLFPDEVIKEILKLVSFKKLFL